MWEEGAAQLEDWLEGLGLVGLEWEMPGLKMEVYKRIQESLGLWGRWKWVQ